MSDLVAELSGLTAAETRRALDAREISAVDIATAYLDRIAQFDGELGVYLHVMREIALAQAAAADRRLAAGEAESLTGIPVALKDVLCTVDAPTTAASWAWAPLSSPGMTLQTCVGSNSQYRLMVRLTQVR